MSHKNHCHHKQVKTPCVICGREIRPLINKSRTKVCVESRETQHEASSSSFESCKSYKNFGVTVSKKFPKRFLLHNYSNTDTECISTIDSVAINVPSFYSKPVTITKETQVFKDENVRDTACGHGFIPQTSHQSTQKKAKSNHCPGCSKSKHEIDNARFQANEMIITQYLNKNDQKQINNPLSPMKRWAIYKNITHSTGPDF